jgi:uncharacterized membrane protein
MAGKSASLLTKTQRNRIRDDFDELGEEKQRRDQQRIRERVRSGLADFQLLADYPDRQFALTFDDASEDELRAVLADTTIIVERLRELHDIDRAELVDEVRAHTEEFSDTTTAGSIEQVDLRTVAEIRRQTEAEVEKRFGTGRWDKRASRLAKLAASLFIPAALIGMYDAYVAELMTTSLFGPLFALLLALLSVILTGWVLITAAQTLKYDIIPALVKLVRNPEAAVRGAFSKLIKNPGETLRESWNEL